LNRFAAERRGRGRFYANAAVIQTVWSAGGGSNACRSVVITSGGIMDETRTVAILSALANGVNPSTGEIFTADSPYQQADVVRALFVALDRFKKTETAKPSPTGPRNRAETLSNVGKPWSDEEDRRLLAEFERGRKPAELARDLGRTLAGIEARLERHGRLSARERTTSNRYPRDKAAVQPDTG
jgi:hypothetical protein